jgi:periplasmic mercuric ion binding protein
MKTKKINLLAFAIITLVMMTININNASSKEVQKSKTITIELNSIQCDMCVEKITEAINSVKGVEKVTVDLDKKNATVTYNTDLTKKKAIEKAITTAGYDANKTPAYKEAYDNLSSCCKKP